MRIGIFVGNSNRQGLCLPYAQITRVAEEGEIFIGSDWMHGRDSFVHFTSFSFLPTLPAVHTLDKGDKAIENQLRCRNYRSGQVMPWENGDHQILRPFIPLKRNAPYNIKASLSTTLIHESKERKKERKQHMHKQIPHRLISHISIL